jgi:hypothetical protein
LGEGHARATDENDGYYCDCSDHWSASAKSV